MVQILVNSTEIFKMERALKELSKQFKPIAKELKMRTSFKTRLEKKKIKSRLHQKRIKRQERKLKSNESKVQKKWGIR